MKIVVFGASGKTGRVFVRLAHEFGHSVTAVVRSTSSYDVPAKVKVVVCDLTIQKDVDNAIARQDAVVSFLGHGKNTPPLLQTNAVQAILRAMKQHKVTRVLSLTGDGVRMPGDSVKFIDWCMNAAINVIDHNRIVDGKMHVQALQQSTVDWTVLRVLKLTNGGSQPNILTLHGPAKILVSRETVAQAALDLLEHKGFVQQAPVISPVIIAK